MYITLYSNVTVLQTNEVRVSHEIKTNSSYRSLIILLVSRSNAGSVPRDRREGSVGPSEGRATVTRSSVVFGLGLQSEID